MGSKAIIILLTAFAATLAVFETYFQARFFRNRAQKVRRIRQRLGNPEFRRYTEALTATNVTLPAGKRLGYALRPNSLAEYDYAPVGGAWSVKINNIGIRDHEDIDINNFESASIILLGDSVSFGAGINYEDSLGYKMQALLNERHIPLKVFNFSVGGYSVLDNLAHFSFQKCLRLNPKLVLYFYTMKSIFDYLRTTDSKTGFHFEKWPGLFLLHQLRVRCSGGKIGFLLRRLGEFANTLESQGIQFVMVSLPAYSSGCLYSTADPNLTHYGEAVIFSREFSMRFPKNFIDASDWLRGENFRDYFRKDRYGQVNEYQVHFGPQGHTFLANTILDRLLVPRLGSLMH